MKSELVTTQTKPIFFVLAEKGKLSVTDVIQSTMQVFVFNQQSKILFFPN